MEQSKLPKPCSSMAGESVIPQMVVTSADDISETTPDSEVETRDAVFKTQPLETIDEARERTPTDSQRSEIPESISDGIVHSVNRPLIIESEKSTAEEMEVCEEDPQKSLSLTTMQRPLVFDGTKVQSEPLSSDIPEEPWNLNKDDEEQIQGYKEDLENESADPHGAKSKTTSFSWMPSFPKLQAGSKETKSHSKDLDKRDAVEQPSQETNKKDGLLNMQKLFDSFRHDSKEENKSKRESETGHDTNVKEEHKDMRHNVAKFFHLKHDISDESSKQVEHQAGDNDFKDQQKEDRHGIKKFFDSFKHDVNDDQKCDNKTESPQEVENTKLHKDSKQSVKKFFDSFKHETSEDLKAKHNKETGLQKEVDCEPHKDSKHGVKKFFGSFKQETSEDKTSKPSKESELQKEVECDTTQHKDAKQTVKKFFDSFKSDVIDDQKIKSTKAIELQNEEIMQHKDSKQSVKKYFGSFKHETSEDKPTKPSKESELQKEVECETTQHKDAKQTVKKFFDSFKSDVKDDQKIKSTKAIELQNEEIMQHKDSKQSVKKFFDSFKQDTGDSLKSKVPKEADLQNKPNEEPKAQHKDTKHSVKKFFDSFRPEADERNSKQCELKQNLNNSQKSENEGEITSMDHRTDHVNENPEQLKGPDELSKRKDGLHSVRNFFDSLMHEKPEQKVESVDITDHEHKLEESRQEQPKSGVKKFFVSFKLDKGDDVNKNASPPIETEAIFLNEPKEREMREIIKKKDSFGYNVPDIKHEQNEHIYDAVELPVSQLDKDLKSGSSKELDGNRKQDDKHKDGHHGVKKLFDSFRHKDPALKPKITKKEPEKSENIYDKVETLESAPYKEPLQGALLKETAVSKEPGGDLKEHKDNLHGVKKLFDSFKHKDTSKLKLEEASGETNKQKTDIPDIQIDIPLTDTADSSKKTMFSSLKPMFGLKDKSSKDIKEIPKDSKVQEYDLQKGQTMEEVPEQIVGTYKPISEYSPSHKVPISMVREKAEVKEHDQKTAPHTSIAVQQPDEKGKESSELKSREPGTPESLYETCCLRLAVLLRNKALDIVSVHTKSPPKKPPKPSAETIAKARAAAVARRVQELQKKGHNFGDVGFDGIRYADDETESSCDYKDVENFDYIMDYELINRYKFDNKLDTFSVPSTCSGMTSYYTADTVTLKDENFSDNTLETVSLGSNDSYLLASLTPIKNEAKNNVLHQPVHKSQSRAPGVLNTVGSKSSATKQELNLSKQKRTKVPPPIPPKPVIIPKMAAKNQKVATGQSSVSECINGLSLSPRLQKKINQELAGTKQRPLMVADVKETEFSSLHQKVQKNIVKGRKFDTVLKNDSLKNISSVSSSHPSLVSSKSSPPQLTTIQRSSDLSLARKISPPRPPPPIIVTKKESKQIPVRIISKPPEKPKRESTLPSAKPSKEKRTTSPPRPPPPVYKTLERPPRPPLPLLSSPLSKLTENEQLKMVSSHDSPDHAEPYRKQESLKHSDIPNVFIEQAPLTSSLENNQNLHEMKSEDDRSNVQDTNCNSFDATKISEQIDEQALHSPSEEQLKNYQPSFDKTSPNLPQEATVSEASMVSRITERKPRPPPRIRRVRSRTVEIVPVEKLVEPRKRRSQSLTETDVEKKIASLNFVPVPDKKELKYLYTTVNKEGKKTNLVEKAKTGLDARSLSLETVSSRPLPAPPPPPRKFRSLDRKTKERSSQRDESESVERKVHPAISDINVGNLSLKPPARKKKTEKQRFYSLGSADSKKHIKCVLLEQTTKNLNASSTCLEHDEKHETTYDENANVAFPVCVEVHHHAPQLEANNVENFNISDQAVKPEINEVSDEKIHPHPRKKSQNAKKSHSSWYDETHPQAEEPWEVIDLNSNEEAITTLDSKPTVPLRRKSDPGKKTRQTSKFYVDVKEDVQSHLSSLVDKETSPLPLDCSEKSVQTSLETLSQGIASRDEKSEDTDDLLDLAQTLQNELKIIINRHKSVSELSEDNPSPSLSAAESEREEPKNKRTSSIRSSTSELFQLTSSEESDEELAHQENLTEIAMNRKKKKIFYIAQEIMTSEEVFVDALKLLNVDFKSHLCI